MKTIFVKMGKSLAGTWTGDGFAKYPTMEDTAYMEQLEFIPDQYKDAILYTQRTWYKSQTARNGQTVFWDTGFIILKEDKIILHSVQVGGRMEMYELVQSGDGLYTFNGAAILNDSQTIRSQRVFSVVGGELHYELNMATHIAAFQNHLRADLRKRAAAQK